VRESVISAESSASEASAAAKTDECEKIE